MGDQVLSRDPQTGEKEAKTVTNTVERHAPSVVDVVLRDAKTGKSETLTCTPEHPLYVQGQGWVEAGSLGIGTSIVSRAGPALEVTDLNWEKNKAQELAAGTGSSFGGYTVYNLTVEDDHTFFVGTANGGTWVHNTGPCSILGKLRKYNEDRIPGYDKHHLDPPLGRDAPEYETDVVVDIRNDNAGGKVPGGLNYHTAQGGFQTSLNDYIKETGGGRANWNALSDADRLTALRRYYGSLGIPFPK